MKKNISKELFDKEFKLKHFGHGEWLDEPDIFEFEYRGIKCLLGRVYRGEPSTEEETGFGGYLCGYIFLPKDHPLWGKRIRDIDVSCHRGVNFAETTEEGHMIGFHCAHFGDLVPSSFQLRKRFPLPDIFPGFEKMKDYLCCKPIYRNMSYCVNECKHMVRQALEMRIIPYG